MKKKLLTIGLVLLVLGAIGSVGSHLFGTDNTTTNGLTKEGYLKIVERNYSADDEFTLTETKCVYSYLIDTYGVQEALYIDTKADESNDIDPRLFEAAERCL